MGGTGKRGCAYWWLRGNEKTDETRHIWQARSLHKIRDAELQNNARVGKHKETALVHKTAVKLEVGAAAVWRKRGGGRGGGSEVMRSWLAGSGWHEGLLCL